LKRNFCGKIGIAFKQTRFPYKVFLFSQSFFSIRFKNAVLLLAKTLLSSLHKESRDKEILDLLKCLFDNISTVFHNNTTNNYVNFKTYF